MSSPRVRDDYLHNYTRRFEYLLASLRTGIWPRYVEEDFSEILGGHGQSIWLAFSMVCFTDMPPEVAHAHQDRYGKYSLAVGKDLASKADIQPLVYLLRDGRFANEIRRHTRPDDGRVRLTEQNPMAVILPYVKITPGSQKMYDTVRGEVWEVLGFEDELEWRFVPIGAEILHAGAHGFITADIQNRTLPNSLVIPDVYLESIVVTTPEEADQVLDEFPRHRSKIRIREADGTSRSAF